MRLAVPLAVLAALAAVPAWPQSAEDAVKARRGYFTMLGIEVDALAAMARGDVAHDPERAAAGAANLAALAAYDFPKLFVDGTSMDDLPGQTRALADIWLDRDDMAAKAVALREALAPLPQAAPAGRAELGAALGEIANACRDCHRAYRARDF